MASALVGTPEPRRPPPLPAWIQVRVMRSSFNCQFDKQSHAKQVNEQKVQPRSPRSSLGLRLIMKKHPSCPAAISRPGSFLSLSYPSYPTPHAPRAPVPTAPGTAGSPARMTRSVVGAGGGHGRRDAANVLNAGRSLMQNGSEGESSCCSSVEVAHLWRQSLPCPPCHACVRLKRHPSRLEYLLRTPPTSQSHPLLPPSRPCRRWLAQR